MKSRDRYLHLCPVSAFLLASGIYDSKTIESHGFVTLDSEKICQECNSEFKGISSLPASGSTFTNRVAQSDDNNNIQ